MATLIQSKQIEGVVTASVITGDFTVESGSVDLTSAQGVTGSFSGSFVGDGTGLTINYSQLQGKPNFQAGTGIVITEVGDTITITNTGGGGSGVSDAAAIAFLNAYTASNDLIINGINLTTASLQAQIDALVSATSSYITSDNTGSDSQTLSIVGDQLTISSGNTITIPTGSGSGTSDFTQLTNVPSGLVSSSAQILDGSGILSGSHTDISSLNNFTASYSTDSASFDSRISTLEGRTDNTGSDNQTLSIIGNQLTIDGGNTITIPTGSSGGVATDITQLNSFTSSADTRITNLENFSSSLNSTFATDSELSSLSSSIATTIGNIQHTQIPSGVISGSTFTDFSSSVESRISTLEGQTDNTGSDTQSLSIVGDQLTISGGNTITIPTGSGETTDISALNTFTSSIQSQVDSLTSATSSYLTELPSGLVSGSVLRTLDSTGVFSGSLVAGTNITINQVGDNFEISSSASGGSASVTVSDSAPGSPSQGDLWWKSDDGNLYIYYDGYWVISTDITTGLPAGVVSGSAQITSVITDSYISASAASSGFGSGGGTSDFTQLTNVPSGLVSGSTQITDGSNIVSGSVLRTLDGTGVVSGSVLRTLDGTNVFSGSIIGQGSITITSGSGNITISGSGGSSDVTFDGNRVISNEDLGDLFTNSVNPGTSGSIQDFLNAVFYPNTGPSISTGNQTISEYTSNGTTIVTLSGTDPEGQAITWGTGSSYTDDLVRVASNGVMTLNALAESSSFNTDSVSGGHGHLVTVKATDTFSTSTEKDIYIIVTPNEAPKFRQTSVGGSVITSFTANLNENSTNGTVVGTIYFTDTESDSITIYSSSIDNNHFVVNKYSTYVQIVQNTGSLDYEQQTSYSFSISASDEHYEAGQDLDSITSLPITINVTDNQIPVVNNQTLSSINENSSNGATVDSISASDNEGDTITFLNFNLHKLLLDGVEVSSGSYGGTSQLTDPTENPFQMNSSGVVTRKSGVYLNSDLINSYQYRVQVKDDFNTSSPASIITIPITDDTPATLSDNFSFTYIIESATNGTAIRTNSNGFSGTQADLNSNQSGTWSSSNPAISINSNGNLSLGVNLSGSVTQSGDVLATTITFTNTFGTTTTQAVSTLVAENQAPTATFTDQSSNFNTNLAIDGTTMVSMSITDAETDTPYSASLGGTNAGDLQLVYTNAASSSVGIQANGNLSAGTYNYDVVVTDSYSKSTTYSGRSFTISEATTGSLSTNGTFYIIESATNGDLIRTSSNGRTGTQGSVSVSYSPNYGSQSAGSFTSSNGLISINSSTGVLSVGTDISGSGNVNGDTITSTIGWTDQYGNVGSDTITVNVAKNNAPSVFSTQTFNTNTNQATGSSEIVRLNLSDTESDTIPNSSLSFTNYNSTYFTPSISTPQMKLLANSTNIPAGTYPYTASIQDVHGFDTTVHSGSVTIAQADNGTLGGDTAIYIIESAVSGAVFRDQTGFNQGSPAQLSVSYSPNYGSAVVQSYTSSNAAIVVDGSGNLTLGVDISGSVTQSGDTFTSTITFRDQYDNIGSGSVTATVFGNSAPSANFTSASSYDTDAATSGSTAGTLTVTDTENNSPYTITLAGTDGGKFDVQGSSSPFTIQPTGSLSDGTYSINITVTDNYGESVTLTNESIIVDTAVSNGKVYVYDLGQYNSNVLFDLGVSSTDSSTPPVVTTYSGNGFLEKIEDGSLGNTSISYNWGTSKTATLLASGSGANLDTIVQGFGTISKTNSNRFVIIAPADLDMTGVPTSMANSYGGSTTGEYVLEVAVDGASFGAGLGTIEDSTVYGVTLGSAVEGTTNYRVIVENNQVASSTSIKMAVVPSSGSTPS